jgi:hypothetical protein
VIGGVLWVDHGFGGLQALPRPRIDRIEPFKPAGVLIHFDTDANRTYELQASDAPLAGGEWKTLFVAPSFPFPNHYVYPDAGGGGRRFYRLYATP